DRASEVASARVPLPTSGCLTASPRFLRAHVRGDEDGGVVEAGSLEGNVKARGARR
ncbi:MAG: hypothetical protein HW413_2265, partial [Thermoleophilia bacterium]|nr:hypothetical protein [Thermoleophilia bacterium]